MINKVTEVSSKTDTDQVGLSDTIKSNIAKAQSDANNALAIANQTKYNSKADSYKG